MVVKRYHGDWCGGKNLVVMAIRTIWYPWRCTIQTTPSSESLVVANDMLKVQSGNKWTYNHMNGTAQLKMTN